MLLPDSYSFFSRFIKTYIPEGFLTISREDSLIVEIEKIMECNNQYFFIADMLKVKILFTSKRSFKMRGIEPDKMDPSTLLNSSHPADLNRLHLARIKLFTMAQEMFINEKGTGIICGDLRVKNAMNEYFSMLCQFLVFFSNIPNKTVFALGIMTDISRFRKTEKGHYFYSGDDLSLFCYPDEGLKQNYSPFTKQEYKILKLISEGLSSRDIARRLFLSECTVNTHRRNALIKTGFPSTIKLIDDLKRKALL